MKNEPWGFIDVLCFKIRPGRIARLAFAGYLAALCATAGAALPTPAGGAIAAGPFHTLALKADGKVWAWGANANGQLGDGAVVARSTPVAVSNLTDVVAIAAGRSHSIALRADGTVWAWGSNASGELGDGTTSPRLRPVQVSGLTDVVAIAAGGLRFNLALKGNGTVFAWGENSSGQLGDGTHTPRLRPVVVPGLAHVREISAGKAHALALLEDGTIRSWGSNSFGQLGDGSQQPRERPVEVKGAVGIVAVTAGTLSHSLALKRAGTVLGWGNNFAGQLAGDVALYRLVPTVIPGLAGIAEIFAGSSHSLARGRDGTMWVWGANNASQLALNLVADHVKPTHPDFWPAGITAISVAGNQTVALGSDGRVLSLGSNYFGQFGDGSAPTVQVFAGADGDDSNDQSEAGVIATNPDHIWHEARGFTTIDPATTP